MYNIAYSNHSIPASKAVVILDTSIFYVHNNGLFIYDISSGSTSLIAKDFVVDRIFYGHGRLYALEKTEVRRYSAIDTIAAGCDIQCSLPKLNLTAVQTLLYLPTNIVTTPEALYFISNTALQVLCFSDFSVITIPAREQIIDMTFSAEICYMLLKNNCIVREKDPLLTRNIQFHRRLKYLSQPTSTVRGISACGNSIILSDDSKTTKYSLVNNMLIQEYSLERSGIVRYGLLISDGLVELGPAPFTLLTERITELHMATDSAIMAYSSTRIYFLNPIHSKPQESNTALEDDDCYDFGQYSRLLNGEATAKVVMPASISFLKESEELNANATNLLKEIRRWKEIHKYLREKQEEQADKVRELKFMYREVKKMAMECDKRSALLRTRIEGIKKRADSVVKEREVQELKNKIEQLKGCMASIRVSQSKEILMKLKSQRAVLRDIVSGIQE